MWNRWSALAAATFVVAWLGSSQTVHARETPPDGVYTPCTAQGGSWGRFQQGSLQSADCAIGAIRRALTETASGNDNFEYYRQQTSNLIYYYSARAQRQQSFSDTGALVTLIGAAGAFQGNLSQQAREAWAITAFTPSIIAQFNAYEPTRELFHGGGLAAQLVTRRYERLNRLIDLLTAADVQTLAIPSPHTCGGWGDITTNIVAKRQNRAYDPEGVLLGEVRRLHAACEALQARAASMKFVANYAKSLKTGFARDYANDILTLNDALVAKDRDMRATPLETLTALVSSPLRAIDFAITGQNAGAGLNSLKTQIAFAGMNRSLSAVSLPSFSAASAVPVVAPLSPSALALSTLEADEVAQVRAKAFTVIEDQYQQAFQEQLVMALVETAQSDYLTFTYDPVTNTTVVQIAPRPVAAAGASSASTGG